MSRIESYTANLASARGSRGQVQAEIDVGSAMRPGRALEQAGDALANSAGAVQQIGAVLDQRKKEQETKWTSQSTEQLTRVLIEWQDKNRHREDYGDAYRKFADEQVDEYVKAAPNSRAADGFRMHVLPGINRDWEGALKQGEHNRFTAFDASEAKAAETNTWAFRERMRLGEPEAARDSLAHDLALQKERIDIFYKNAPGKAVAQKEIAVTGAVLGALETDPAFAKEILDANRNVDPQTRSMLVGRIQAAQIRIGSQELALKQQEVQGVLSDARRDNATIQMPDLSLEKSLMEPGQFVRYEQAVKQDYTVHNQTVQTVRAAAPLSGPVRNAEFAKAASATSGATGEAVRVALFRANEALNREFEADSLAYVTKYHDDIQNAYAAYRKSGRQEDEDYWRTLAWDRLGHAPSRSEQAGGMTFVRSDSVLATYQGLPEAERRFLMADEAKGYGEALTKGGHQERLDAVQQLNAKFPDERKRAVAIKDIEQLSVGKEHDIQRTLIAAKLAEVNPDAARFLLSGNGREAFKALKPDIQKQIGELLSVGVAGSDPSFSLFAQASRGAGRESQDLVNGFKTALEEVAALNFKDKPEKAVQTALKTLIFDRVALPVMTPSVGSSTGQALLIGRSKINPQTGKVDPALGLRTDAEIYDITQRIGYAKEVIQPEDMEIYSDDKRPKALLKEYILQKGFWVSNPDNQGATFYMQGEGGFSFAPVFKMTGHPLVILYSNPPMTEERRKGTGYDIQIDPSSY